MHPAEMLNAVIIGAGSRGANVFADLMATQNVGFVVRGVVEPNAYRRNAFQSRFGVEKRYSFASVDEFLNAPRFADIVFICTPDGTHYELCRQISEQQYAIVLEKPIATTLSECHALIEVQRRYGNAIFVAHVLRYAPLIREVKRILSSGELGSIRHIRLIENMGYWHFAHSYVRGQWRRADQSGPIILTKACHDLDLLQWFVDEPVQFVSSVGNLTYFRKEHAPLNAAERCVQCPRESDCLFSAPRFYVNEETGWPHNVIVRDGPDSLEHRLKSLEDGPYGSCVFHSDNDVCDNQLVALEFRSGILANFGLHSHTAENTRELTILCDGGQLSANVGRDHLEVTRFSARGTQNPVSVVDLPQYGDSHGGGDLGLLTCVHEHVTKGMHDDLMTSLRSSIESHQLAFQAETSRLQGGVKLPAIDGFVQQFVEMPPTRSA